ncbi:hypothetical protein HPB52_008982 [Rhipicephalus sanguineus]|uniref:Peptidase M13 N-terminal domain-containing protein n=1 Tax=Rhipicephalus sanguineus TaxID=34632 RepID=A0A9D4T1X9_RHISA|nr:hypothetical protein HPB52_008982 [Rhipicephalus sanguineus]
MYAQSSRSLRGKLSGNAKLWMAALAVIVLGAILFAFVRIARRRRPSALQGASCSSESCERYKELLKDVIDSSSDSCDNYYKHMCSLWTKSHSRSVPSNALEHFIDSAIAGIRSLPSIKDVVTRKGTMFFADCLSVANVSNVANVKKLLAVGGIVWPKRNAKPDFLNALFYMSRSLFVPVFFSFQVSENGKTLKVIPDEDFSDIFLILRGHMKTNHLLQYLTVTYEAFDNLDHDRLKEIVERLYKLTPFLERHVESSGDDLNESDDSNTYNVESFLRMTPSVSRDRWDTVLERYFVTSVANLNAAFVEGVSQFKALMKLHQDYDEPAVNDLVEALCVQSLVRYTSLDIITTLHKSSDIADVWLQKKCFFSTFTFFGYDINRYFLSKRGDALGNVEKLAKRVRREFFALLKGSENEPGSRDEQRKNASEHYFGNVFAVLNTEAARAYPKVYLNYPNMTGDPLKNWQILNEHYHELPKTASSALLKFSDKNMTKFLEFSLLIPHLSFPYYEPDAHVGAVLGGLGLHVAAAVYYDYAESQANSTEFYQRNQDCLAHLAGSEQADYNLQGAVAAVPVIYSIFKKAREDSGNALVQDLPPFEADRIPFMIGCYLMCGEVHGERMCNVPLKHSEDFARAYGCAPGSQMNPVKKCVMVP